MSAAVRSRRTHDENALPASILPHGARRAGLLSAGRESACGHVHAMCVRASIARRDKRGLMIGEDGSKNARAHGRATFRACAGGAALGRACAGRPCARKSARERHDVANSAWSRPCKFTPYKRFPGR